MQKLFPVTGIYKHYHWGSQNGLCEIIGIENQSEKPIAEIWYGAHPSSPSQVLTETGEVSMGEVFGRHPEIFSSHGSEKKSPAHLPVMMKFLSAAAPLSLQVHPDKSFAEKGYDKENQSNIAIDAPERNYRDRSSKPESLLALSDFYALRGFHTYPEIISNLEKFCPVSLKKDIEKFSVNQTEEGLKTLLVRLLDPRTDDRHEIITEALSNGEKYTETDPAAQWITKLHRFYPEDTALLAPAFLNLIHLKPGDAFSISPGIMHCYLQGTGIEIMTLSDNVLRGGLTSKHRDLDELLKITDFTPTAKRYFSTDTGYVQTELPAETGDYRAEKIAFESVQGRILLKANRGPSMFLAVKGACTIRTLQGESREMKPGDCILTGSNLGFVTLEGSATLVMTTVPED